MLSTKPVKNNDILPKELTTAVLGIGIGSTSSVAMQFFESSYNSWRYSLKFLNNFVVYGCSAGAVVGAVISIYSMIRLCQRIISQDNELNKAATATGLGIILTASAHTIGEYFWDIAPYFSIYNECSLTYCIGTNLAWQVSALTGFSCVLFTAYAAYRLGQILVNRYNQPEIETLITEQL